MKNTKIISTEPEPCFTAVITEFILFRPTCLYSEFIIYHFTHETDPRNIVINYFFSTLIRFRSLILSNCCCSCNTWNKIAYVCTVQLLNINWQKNITQNYLHAKQHNTAKIPRNGGYKSHNNKTTMYATEYVRRVEAAAAAVAATKHNTQYKYEKYKIKCDKKNYTRAHFFIILLALLYLLWVTTGTAWTARETPYFANLSTYLP